MAAQDIRRQIEDVNTRDARFVRPGVTNTALAEAITGVGGSLIDLDVSLAKERLGKDLDQARSEFLVGETNDANGGPADPQLQKQLKEELAPFEKQLGNLSNAQRQGLLRGDRFKMQADAILQSHIASRPGLAPEFREIHAQYTGGAIIETLMKHEQDQYDAAITAMQKDKKASEEQVEKNRTFQLNLMKEAGYAAEAGALAYASPEEVNAKFVEFYPQISRQEHTKERAAVLSSAAQGVEAGYALDRPASLQTWQSQFDLSLEGVLKTLRESRPALAAATEDEFAQMATTWRGAIAQVKSNLEATRTRLGLKPDDVAAQMQIIASMEENGSKLLDGSIAFDERKRRVESFNYILEAQLQNDSPLLASIASLEQRGAHEVVKWMYENNSQLSRTTAQEMMEFVVKGAGKPEVVSPLAGGFSQSLLKSMFPEGSQTKNPSVDMPAAMKLLTDFGTAFSMTPSDSFKVKPYTEWIQELTAFATPLTALTDGNQLIDLAESVRISAHKALRVGYLSLLSEHPQLKGNLKWSAANPNEPFVLTDDSDPVLAKVVDQANQQMAYGATVRLLTKIGGYESEMEASNHILKSADELMGQEAKATLAARERAQEPAGRMGPAVGAVEDGYVFKGGDPSKPENWEKQGE